MNIERVPQAAGPDAMSVKNLHWWFDFQTVDEIFGWLHQEKINYHCFVDDLFFYDEKDLTTFLLLYGDRELKK